MPPTKRESSFPLDRLPICFEQYQMAVFPNKLILGECQVDSNSLTYFDIKKSFVLIHTQFDLFAKTLADFTEMFGDKAQLLPDVGVEIEVDFNSSRYGNQKLIQNLFKNGLTLHISKDSYRKTWCDHKTALTSSYRWLIEVFLELVLKAFCYPPALTKALMFCQKSVLKIGDFDNINERQLYELFDKTTRPWNADDVVMADLILRHKDLLFQMCRLQSFL